MKILWKCIAVLGIVSTLFGLSSCGRKQNVWDDELAADEISLRSYQNIAFYDGYSYFPNLVFDKNGKEIGRTLVRQNLTTGAISFACPDPLCSHDTLDCPFYCGSGFYMTQFFGEWIINQARVGIGTYRRILYNMNTGEWREIFKLFNSDSFDSVIFSNGTDLFCTYFGGESKKAADGEEYFPCNIYKHNLKNGKEEIVYSSRTDISILCVTQKYVYFYETIPESKYSLKTHLKNYRYRFGDDEAEEITDKIIPNQIAAVFQNKLYGRASNGNRCAIQNLTTGEVTYPLGDLSRDVQFVKVTDKYVYYSTREGLADLNEDAFENDRYYREAIDKAVGEEKDRLKKEYSKVNREYGTAWRLIPLKIWRTDLDGNNLEFVIELKNWSATFFSVYNGELYMPYSNVNPETGDAYDDDKDKIGLVCRVDLETGEKTVLIDLIDEEDW